VSLYHLSDDPGIARFDPRPSAYTAEPVVWAIAPERVVNYLTPRDCPRVCFRAGPDSSGADVERHLGSDTVVVAIETAWLERLRTGKLHRYVMPRDRFVLADESAGYWVSHGPVTPLDVDALDDLPAAIAGEGAALRVLPSLWDLHDAVRTSSLVYSMIRMRNALGRAGP
jgi:hypothetical protein